jgi:hypothetical protein
MFSKFNSIATKKLSPCCTLTARNSSFLALQHWQNLTPMKWSLQQVNHEAGLTDAHPMQGRFLSTKTSRKNETLNGTIPRSPSTTNKDDDSAASSLRMMDDLCQKHMELTAQEFAMGCSFLHLTALGNLSELKRLIQLQPSLVNFRDYDRRTPLVSCAVRCERGFV